MDHQAVRRDNDQVQSRFEWESIFHAISGPAGLLLLNRQSVLSKSAIEEKLYPWGEEVSSNSVEVLVHRIRRKLGTGFIKTVHSVGYTLGEA